MADIPILYFSKKHKIIVTIIIKIMYFNCFWKSLSALNSAKATDQ